MHTAARKTHPLEVRHRFERPVPDVAMGVGSLVAAPGRRVHLYLIVWAALAGFVAAFIGTPLLAMVLR